MSFRDYLYFDNATLKEMSAAYEATGRNRPLAEAAIYHGWMFFPPARPDLLMIEEVKRFRPAVAGNERGRQ